MQARLTLKVQYGEDLRRLTVDSKTFTWEGLQNVMKSMFKSKTPEQWERTRVRYADDEGDMCTISSDVEFQEALALSMATPRPLLKLVLEEQAPVPSAPTEVLSSLLNLLGDTTLAQVLAQNLNQQQAPCSGPARPGFTHHRDTRVKADELANEGIALMDAKDFVSARAKFTEQLALYLRPWHKSVPLYNIACCDALIGNSESALEFLEQAIQCGYRDVEHMKADEDLLSLRNLERFQALVIKLSEPPLPAFGSRCPWARPGFKHRQEWFELQQQACSLLEEGTPSSLLQAREMFEKQVKLAPGIWGQRIPLYNLACCEARLGNTEKALNFLRESIKAGYRNLRHVEGDEDLASLRNLEEFKEIVSTIKSGHRFRRCGRFEAPEQPEQCEERKLEPEVEAGAEEKVPEDLADEIPLLEESFVALPDVDEDVAQEPPVEAENGVSDEWGKYKTQLEVMGQMGFVFFAENVRALQNAGGNVAQAVNILLG